MPRLLWLMFQVRYRHPDDQDVRSLGALGRSDVGEQDRRQAAQPARETHAFRGIIGGTLLELAHALSVGRDVGRKCGSVSLLMQHVQCP